MKARELPLVALRALGRGPRLQPDGGGHRTRRDPRRHQQADHLAGKLARAADVHARGATSGADALRPGARRKARAIDRTKIQAPANMCAAEKPSSWCRSKRRRRSRCTGCCRGYWNSRASIRTSRSGPRRANGQVRTCRRPTSSSPAATRLTRCPAARHRVSARRAADGDLLAGAFGAAPDQRAGRLIATAWITASTRPGQWEEWLDLVGVDHQIMEGGHRFDHLSSPWQLPSAQAGIDHRAGKSVPGKFSKGELAAPLPDRC